MNKLILSSLLWLFCMNLGAQQIDSTLAIFGNQYQYEKTWIHFDKPAYVAGETIWFKAYLMEDLYPARNSKTLYVDWISPDGRLLSHTVSPLVNGTTNGQLEIPAEFKGNYIHVRAYTKWMLNFDTAFLFSQDIPVLSGKKDNAAKKPAPSTTVQFFPEGGDAIENIINKIAFKAHNEYGDPVNFRGALTDGSGRFLDSIRSIHNGMGYFLLKPENGKTYSVKYRDQKGQVITVALPQPKSSGIAMQVHSDDSKKTILLEAPQLLPASLSQVHIIGTMNQRMAFKTSVSMQAATQTKRVIPTGNLPSGVLVITVFDDNWKALAERITFVNNHEYAFPTEMEVQHWGMGKRKRNEIEITVPEKLAGASLSISVTDASIGTDSSQHIISHFLLSSEIRGKVHDPAYYFRSSDPQRAGELELVMLTHGWRRFNWENLVAGKLPEIKHQRDSDYLHLSGQLFGVAKSQLSGSDHLVLIAKEDSSTQMMILPIATDGSFGDPEIILFDTIRVYYSLKSKFFKSAEARFMQNRLAAPDYSAFTRSRMFFQNLSDTGGNYQNSRMAAEMVRIQEILKGKMMETVTLKAKQRTTVEELENKYASGMFKGDAFQFDLVNDVQSSSYQTALQYLQGKVAGLQITDNPPSLSWRGGAPAVFLDEIATDLNMISTIPVTDIAYIKVFRPPFLGGRNGGNGAIAIYTRRGNDIRSGGQGLSAHTIAGYSAIREFYSPDYDRFDPRNEQPDSRTTLYWNPMVNMTPGNNKVKLTFYNNDISEAFRVTITGMSADGLLTHYSEIME